MKGNLNQIKEYVRTQYGDLKGVIQIDGHENITSIYQLCKDYGIDTSRIFIAGFGLGESTISGIGEDDSVYCKILYVNKSEYGNNFDEISEKIKSKGKIVLEQKRIVIKYSELRKYIKRYDFIVTTELTKYANEIELKEEENE
jgi:hypothetical protein